MGPRFHTELEAVYRDMRQAHGSVVPVELPGDVPAWLVIGYREMYQVTSDPVLFPRDAGLWNQWDTLPEDWPLRPMVGSRQPSVYFTVGDEHRRHLAMVQGALERVDHTELRRHAEELADRLIDGFCGTGEAEVISAYAKPLPVLVLARVLGFPDSDGPELISTLGAMADGGPDAIHGYEQAIGLMYRLVERKRQRPGADVLSYMMAFPDTFTDEEYVLDLMALTAAGYLPMADWIGNSMRLMLTDDRFAASLTGGRHSIAEAMNEVLWEDTPTQILAGRWAARDTRLGGQRIAAGDMLLLGLGGANADPSAHAADPADGLRNSNFAHFAFSHGEFQCPFPAQEMAEIVCRTGIEVLLDRLPGIDLAVPPQTLGRRPSPFLRGLSVLPVHFTPVHAQGGR
ncbi:cytochrome P450 [Streptomyces iconiensis]|uniref:Cytochrome P450 n=2 Tax=Streptomyces iconiensis TaxID=1384038 RepID=A0ABT6ZXS9_9ACTN|nr:cytochrome P450 [Streptomyces iconiensis]MDJ1133878.1 cytochrome P450 [Streptomyces iconiensis]